MLLMAYAMKCSTPERASRGHGPSQARKSEMPLLVLILFLVLGSLSKAFVIMFEELSNHGMTFIIGARLQRRGRCCSWTPQPLLPSSSPSDGVLVQLSKQEFGNNKMG
uniref:Uncharacterized protein n=1 Tax=Oryza glumipatula TaxID=40148 RepID=A0A0E0BMQ2_9ORYZ